MLQNEFVAKSVFLLNFTEVKPTQMVKKFFFSILLLLLFSAAEAQTKVLLMKIQDNIDPRTSRYTELALQKAREIEADLVILKLDTYGGALIDADSIRSKILDFKKPVYAFIDKNAASAGALISIACDSIYMAAGSSIGAATVVTQEGDAAPDKYQSYMRSIMRSTAEATGRNPEIAEAMVDEDLVVDSISEAGKVITFSVSEAIKYGFCEAQVTTVNDILKRQGITNYEVTEFKLDLTDRIIALFLNPFVSGILILLIIGGIYFELQTPGIGFPLLASVVAAILYFTPYYLNGLAENWEIILFVIGILLVMVEIFVIPGFGVAGISGIIISIGALVLVMLNNDSFDFSFVDMNEIFVALITALAGVLGALVLMIIAGVKLTDSYLFRRIALQDVQDPAMGFSSSVYVQKSLIGKKGVAKTVLRPSGRIEIEGEVYDAYTRGEYIEPNTTVEVISDEGTSLKVKEVKG